MNLRVVLSVVAILGAAAPSLASPPPCPPSPTPAEQYKFSKAALEKVLDKVSYVRDGVKYYDIKKAAKLLAPTWCEVFNEARKDTPPLLIFSRWDEIGIAVGDECLYAASSGSICSGGTEPSCGPDGNGNCCSSPKVCGWNDSRYTTDKYTRAYFHPGMGPWQLDTRGAGRGVAAFEAVDPNKAAEEAKRLLDSLGWDGGWKSCERGCCQQVYDEILVYDEINRSYSLNVCADESVTELGGMIKWKCLWKDTAINCYLLDPDLAEGSSSAPGNYTKPNGDGSMTPLAFPFINFTDPTGNNEYRIWLKIVTGYDADITAKRRLGGDARCDWDCKNGVVWQKGLPAGLSVPVLSTATSNQVDLVLLIDTTGSMWDDIEAVKNAAVDIVKRLFETPGASERVRVAVAEYKDFPVDPYGGEGDFPYRAIQGFTYDKSAVLSALKSLPSRVGGGADWEESVYFALLSAYRARCLGQWRLGAKRIILVMGDAPPHDPEPFTGLTLRWAGALCLAAGLSGPVGGVSLDDYPCEPRSAPRSAPLLFGSVVPRTGPGRALSREAPGSGGGGASDLGRRGNGASTALVRVVVGCTPAAMERRCLARRRPRDTDVRAVALVRSP
jgi:hypothetical protein